MLTQVFLSWYHQFKYYKEARATLTEHFMERFKLTSEFIDIIGLNKELETGDADPLLEEDFRSKISAYLLEKIRDARLQSPPEQTKD